MARLSADLGPAASGESIAAYSDLLGGLVDGRRFPALRAAIDAGAYDYPAGTPAQERRLDYRFGLARILDGVAALIRAADAPPPITMSAPARPNRPGIPQEGRGPGTMPR
jgi:hypothetical protein